MIFQRKLLIFIICSFVWSSCEKKDDYSKITINHIYQASFSFAIGESFLNLKFLGENLPEGWEKIDSLLSIPDTIILRDYLPFNYTELRISETNKIDSMIVKLRGYNEFPSKGNIQLFFTDAYKNPINENDTILNLLIQEGHIQNDSIVSQAAYFEAYIYVNEQYLNQLNEIQFICIAIFLENKQKYKQFYPYYKKFKVNVGLGVQLYFFDFNLNALN